MEVFPSVPVELEEEPTEEPMEVTVIEVRGGDNDQSNNDPDDAGPLAKNTTNTTNTTEPDMIEFIRRQIHKLHNTKRSSMALELLPLSEGPKFGGGVIRNPQSGQPMRMLSESIPEWVVPMYAPFSQPYVGDWMAAMQKAIDFVLCRDHLDFHDTNEHLIVVPINSPGGNISLLKKMINMINTVKSMAVQDHETGESRRRIKFVTYGSGMVASCAFVLYQLGDVCMSSEDAQFLCHEPMIMGGNSVESAEQAERTACDLHETQDEIYELAEDCLLHRFYNHKVGKPYRPGSRERRIQARMLWWKSHQTELMAFLKSCHGLTAEDVVLPAYKREVRRKSIFHYVTERIAEDRHDKIILPEWMQRLSLADVVGVDLVVTRQEDLHITKNDAFHNRIAYDSD